MFACTETDKSGRGNTQIEGQKVVQVYQDRLTSAVPYPLDEMTDSTERRNIRERLLRFNDPSKIGYVYELTDFGQVIAYFTISGKVSSISSQLTPTSQTTCIPIANRDDPCFVVDSPMDDGSYGPSEDGVFFFTTEGVLMQWNGLYQYSDYPLEIDTETLTIKYDSANAEPINVAPEVEVSTLPTATPEAE